MEVYNQNEKTSAPLGQFSVLALSSLIYFNIHNKRGELIGKYERSLVTKILDNIKKAESKGSSKSYNYGDKLVTINEGGSTFEIKQQLKRAVDPEESYKLTTVYKQFDELTKKILEQIDDTSQRFTELKQFLIDKSNDSNFADNLSYNKVTRFNELFSDALNSSNIDKFDKLNGGGNISEYDKELLKQNGFDYSDELSNDWFRKVERKAKKALQSDFKAVYRTPNGLVISMIDGTSKKVPHIYSANTDTGKSAYFSFDKVQYQVDDIYDIEFVNYLDNQLEKIFDNPRSQFVLTKSRFNQIAGTIGTRNESLSLSDLEPLNSNNPQAKKIYNMVKNSAYQLDETQEFNKRLKAEANSIMSSDSAAVIRLNDYESQVKTLLGINPEFRTQQATNTIQLDNNKPTSINFGSLLDTIKDNSVKQNIVTSVNSRLDGAVIIVATGAGVADGQHIAINNFNNTSVTIDGVRLADTQIKTAAAGFKGTVTSNMTSEDLDKSYYVDSTNSSMLVYLDPNMSKLQGSALQLGDSLFMTISDLKERYTNDEVIKQLQLYGFDNPEDTLKTFNRLESQIEITPSGTLDFKADTQTYIKSMSNNSEVSDFLTVFDENRKLLGQEAIGVVNKGLKNYIDDKPNTTIQRIGDTPNFSLELDKRFVFDRATGNVIGYRLENPMVGVNIIANFLSKEKTATDTLYPTTPDGVYLDSYAYTLMHSDVKDLYNNVDSMYESYVDENGKTMYRLEAKPSEASFVRPITNTKQYTDTSIVKINIENSQYLKVAKKVQLLNIFTQTLNSNSETEFKDTIKKWLPNYEDLDSKDYKVYEELRSLRNKSGFDYGNTNFNTKITSFQEFLDDVKIDLDDAGLRYDGTSAVALEFSDLKAGGKHTTYRNRKPSIDIFNLFQHVGASNTNATVLFEKSFKEQLATTSELFMATYEETISSKETSRILFGEQMSNSRNLLGSKYGLVAAAHKLPGFEGQLAETSLFLENVKQKIRTRFDLSPDETIMLGERIRSNYKSTPNSVTIMGAAFPNVKQQSMNTSNVSVRSPAVGDATLMYVDYQVIETNRLASILDEIKGGNFDQAYLERIDKIPLEIINREAQIRQISKNVNAIKRITNSKLIKPKNIDKLDEIKGDAKGKIEIQMKKLKGIYPEDQIKDMTDNLLQNSDFYMEDGLEFRSDKAKVLDEYLKLKKYQRKLNKLFEFQTTLAIAGNSVQSQADFDGDQVKDQQRYNSGLELTGMSKMDSQLGNDSQMLLDMINDPNVNQSDITTQMKKLQTATREIKAQIFENNNDYFSAGMDDIDIANGKAKTISLVNLEDSTEVEFYIDEVRKGNKAQATMDDIKRTRSIYRVHDGIASPVNIFSAEKGEFTVDQVVASSRKVTLEDLSSATNIPLSAIDSDKVNLSDYIYVDEFETAVNRNYINDAGVKQSPAKYMVKRANGIMESMDYNRFMDEEKIALEKIYKVEERNKAERMGIRNITSEMNDRHKLDIESVKDQSGFTELMNAKTRLAQKTQYSKDVMKGSLPTYFKAQIFTSGILELGEQFAPDILEKADSAFMKNHLGLITQSALNVKKADSGAYVANPQKGLTNIMDKLYYSTSELEIKKSVEDLLEARFTYSKADMRTHLTQTGIDIDSTIVKRFFKDLGSEITPEEFKTQLDLTMDSNGLDSKDYLASTLKDMFDEMEGVKERLSLTSRLGSLQINPEALEGYRTKIIQDYGTAVSELSLDARKDLRDQLEYRYASKLADFTEEDINRIRSGDTQFAESGYFDKDPVRIARGKGSKALIASMFEKVNRVDFERFGAINMIDNNLKLKTVGSSLSMLALGFGTMYAIMKKDDRMISGSIKRNSEFVKSIRKNESELQDIQYTYFQQSKERPILY